MSSIIVEMRARLTTVASLFKRFLTIGNLMRRLELVTESPQSRCVAWTLR